jgi:hypothetical protein
MCRVYEISIGDEAVTAITGTWKNGRIILDSPTDWPDGCRVIIEPVPEGEILGLREEDWADTPEAIAEWLRWYDALEPLVMTPEEDAKWQAARKAQKEHDIAAFEKRTRRIERLFP